MPNPLLGPMADAAIRFLDGQRTGVKDGDLIDIVPAIAGGGSATAGG